MGSFPRKMGSMTWIDGICTVNAKFAVTIQFHADGVGVIWNSRRSFAPGAVGGDLFWGKSGNSESVWKSSLGFSGFVSLNGGRCQGSEPVFFPMNRTVL